MAFLWPGIWLLSLLSFLAQGAVDADSDLVSIDLVPVAQVPSSLTQRHTRLRVGATLATTTNKEPWDVYMGPLGSDAVRAPHVYSAEIKLGRGSSVQRFDVLFDTGSSNLVVLDQRCHDQACLSHRRYLNRSEAIGAMQEVNYAYGKMETIPYCDSLCFGAGALCIKDQRVLSTIHDFSTAMTGFSFDGILGMAPLSNFTESVLRQCNSGTGPAKPIFALYLSRDEHIRRSEMTIGGYRQSLLDNKLTWLPQHGLPGKWAFQLMDISVGGRRLHVCGYGARECRAILDSGTSQIVGPSAWAEKVKQRLNVDTDCKKNGRLPSMSILSKSGETFTLEPEDYVHRMSRTGGCFAAVTPMEGFSDDTLILGLPFLRKFYSVYDIEKNMVGLGLAKVPNAVVPNQSPVIPRAHLASSSKHQRVTNGRRALHIMAAFSLFFLLSSGVWLILKPKKEVPTSAYSSAPFVFDMIR